MSRPVARFWKGEFSRTEILRGFYFPSLAALAAGILLGIRHYPGPFDWQYEVISGLASAVDNPNGHRYFCAGFGLSILLLVPLAGFISKVLQSRTARVASTAFRLGLFFSLLVALERGLLHNLSNQLHKGHEVLALLAFTGLYTGVLGYWVAWVIESTQRGWISKALLFTLLVGPLLAAAMSQLYLYLAYEGLGWVNSSWRGMGIPAYLSFAFWQWVAAGGTYLYLGMLIAFCRKTTAKH